MAKQAEKNPVGRPSELIPTLEKAKEYLYGGYESVGEVVPTIAGLACYTEKRRNTIYDYASQDEEFSNIVEGILRLQESKLVNEGLKGNFNSTIAKLILSKHGYADSQDLKHSSPDGSMTPVSIGIQFVNSPVSE